VEESNTPKHVRDQYQEYRMYVYYRPLLLTDMLSDEQNDRNAGKAIQEIRNPPIPHDNPMMIYKIHRWLDGFDT
jgi:hypothetical protein